MPNQRVEERFRRATENERFRHHIPVRAGVDCCRQYRVQSVEELSVVPPPRGTVGIFEVLLRTFLHLVVRIQVQEVPDSS